MHRKQRNGATFESEPAKVAPASPGDLGSVPVAASAPVSASHSPQAAAHTYSTENMCVHNEGARMKVKAQILEGSKTKQVISFKTC